MRDRGSKNLKMYKATTNISNIKFRLPHSQAHTCLYTPPSHTYTPIHVYTFSLFLNVFLSYRSSSECYGLALVSHFTNAAWFTFWKTLLPLSLAETHMAGSVTDLLLYIFLLPLWLSTVLSIFEIVWFFSYSFPSLGHK